MMDGKIAHQARRLEIAESKSRLRRAWWALGELARGRYSRYSPGRRHFIKDLLF
jgi:hypothetical protein